MISSNKIYHCGYQTRAHPNRTKEFSFQLALKKILEEINIRNQERTLKWDRKIQEGKVEIVDETTKVYRPLDEMIDIAICLNVDPRKPGQNLRGSLTLPNGTGKVIRVAVFSEDEDIIQQSLKYGATLAGGESLLNRIAENYNRKGPSTTNDTSSTIPSWDVSIASFGIMPIFHQLGLPRHMAPRNLFPNTKVGTLVPTPADLLPLLKERITGGTVMFKTDKEGVINMPVGKQSLGMDQLLENGRAIMTHLSDIKPPLYGRGKKKPSAKGKYIRLTSLSCTQGRKGYRLDTRVLDPTSPLFFDPFDLYDKKISLTDIKRSRREAEIKKLEEEQSTSSPPPPPTTL